MQLCFYASMNRERHSELLFSFNYSLFVCSSAIILLMLMLELSMHATKNKDNHVYRSEAQYYQEKNKLTLTNVQFNSKSGLKLMYIPCIKIA